MPKRKYSSVTSVKKHAQYMARLKRRRYRAKSRLAVQVKKNTQLLRKTVEGKQIYINTSGDLDDTATNNIKVINLIDGLAQGVADTGTGSSVSSGARIGNSVNVQSLSFRLILDGQQKGATVQNPQAKSLGAVRVLLVDSPEGQSFVVEDFLRSYTSASDRIVSMYQVAQNITKKYTILYDKCYTFTDASTMKHITFRKKYMNGGKKIIYDNNATSPNNYRPQLILLTYNCDGNVNQFFLESKVRYIDM